MKKETKQNSSRLSLQDFKIKQVDNKKELEKLTGGLAAGCHRVTCESLSNMHWD